MNLPATGALPEAVRYTWPFKVTTAAGIEKTYQLQAKYTNYASATLLDDPAGHARGPGQFFQLRGNCVASYMGLPVANCPHIGWLTGEFDTAEDIVRIRLPLGASFAPDIKPGTKIERNLVIGLTIQAAYQAVVSNANTADEALWEEEFGPYTVPTKDVVLGIAPAGTDPADVEFTTTAAVDADGSFSGSLDATGLVGDYEVFAKACFGANCGVAVEAVTL